MHTCIFFLFSPLQPQFCIYISPGPAATTPQPTPHESTFHVQLLSHSLSPLAEGQTLFSAPPDTTAPTPRPALPELSWRFNKVQAETWHLSYTCVRAPLGLYLAQGLRQLCCCQIYTILNNCLCCWCFPEPGVVSDSSAVFFVIPAPPLHPPPLLLLLWETVPFSFPSSQSQDCWWELWLPGWSLQQFLHVDSWSLPKNIITAVNHQGHVKPD